MDEARLARLEEAMKNVSEDMADMKLALKDIASAMKSLAILEERSNSTAESFQRVYKTIERNTERLTQLELKVPHELAPRLSKIETAMPNITLASSWVFKAVLAVMGISGTASILIILKAILTSKGVVAG